ncbi:tRNA (adenosine(37)-N6)-dimethylallyltransferase MiaA [Roseobacter sp. HKCCA0434]|uniref:tRNA (adenosine(37)-N6)-dimethylallyltransferase MiaA n=1 Tax=Roseobacter sp. HKCCA0434 TaxID=3079297 RepID=UPI002905BA79|nr:tRNA (adenosine(37)-N6)-dimethylallyltransferase MiaA [Roseobacter sp. HKCCA0434]
MRPVLIAGPTASGKSALALALAKRMQATIVNADALQVYARWRLLSARPSDAELARARHVLYGHVGDRQAYSTGHWLREVAPYLGRGTPLVIVGGTGLNFHALTHGLALIPATSAEIRAEADARGAERMRADLADRDPRTMARIDAQNPMRVQRAWEVLTATGRGLADWQDETPPPLLSLRDAVPILLDADIPWLNARIARRFDRMLEGGALDEARAALPGWDPTMPSAKAIGAPELIAHLRGETDLDTARAKAVTASRQYAKRQRTWFRNRMKDWSRVPIGDRSDPARMADEIITRATMSPPG